MKCPGCGKTMSKLWDMAKGGWYWACVKCGIEGKAKRRGDNPAIPPVRK